MMEFGALFPTYEIGNDPIVIRDFAQTAEDLGYSHILTYDHVVGAVHENRQPPLSGPYTQHDPFHEPMTLFAYLAAFTKRLNFATGVMILPQRQTVLVAKQAAEIAVLSGGRFRLGVGTGWNYVEYDSLGADFKQRGVVLEEQVQVLRKLWSEPIVDLTGRFHRIERAGLNPLPPYPIPIWMGGVTRVALERAARIGDGFIFGGHPDAPRSAEQLLEMVRKNGRDPTAFGLEILMGIGFGQKRWHEGAEIWKRLGARYLTIRTLTNNQEPALGYTKPQQHIDALKIFMAEMKDHRG